MSNPFEALDFSDDEEDQFVGTKDAQKVRKSNPFFLFSSQGKKIIEKNRNHWGTKGSNWRSKHWSSCQSPRKRQISQT